MANIPLKRRTHQPANDLLPAPPCLLSHAVLRVEPAQPFCFSRLNIRTYGAKSESAAQGHTVTDAKHRKGACCRQFVISCKIYVINIKIETE